MHWWYIADALGVVVFVPALAYALRRLIRPLRALDRTLRGIAADSAVIAASLDGVDALAETQMLTAAGLPGVVRVSDALDGAL